MAAHQPAPFAPEETGEKPATLKGVSVRRRFSILLVAVGILVALSGPAVAAPFGPGLVIVPGPSDPGLPVPDGTIIVGTDVNPLDQNPVVGYTALAGPSASGLICDVGIQCHAPSN